MIVLFLSSLLSLFLFIVFGVYATRTIKARCNFVEIVLVGLVVTNTITTCLSLFFKINIFVLILLTLSCSFLVLLKPKEFRVPITLLNEKRRVILYTLPFALLAFIISLNDPSNYDTGLYHLQAIKWIEEFAVVPGLANLHGRFGFNPNIFTLFALTSIPVILKQEIFSVNFTIFIVIVYYFVDKLYLLFKYRGFSESFVVYFIVFSAILKLSYNLPTPSPDFLSTIITLYIFMRMYDLSDQKDGVEFRNHIPILILCVYIVTVKLATLPILLLSLLIFVRYKPKLRKSLRLLSALGLIIVPWLVRNVILTGWLIYPFPSLNLFSFDWQVPLGNVILEKDAVRGWARNPGIGYIDVANTNLVAWFPIWWQRLSLLNKILLVASLSFPSILLIGQALQIVKASLIKNAITTTSFVGVLFWLVMAPAWRLGISFIAVASIAPLLFLRFYWLPPYKAHTIFTAIVIVLIGCFAGGNYSAVGRGIYDTVYSNRAIIPKRINIPSGINFKIYDINGMDVYIPTEDDRCFDHNIPCTPYPDTMLKLRGNTLESGFRRE